MSEEYKPFVKGSTYVPYILPEWKNQCNSDEPDQQDSKIVQLTDEVASNYAKISSHVGWKRRVDYALKHLDTNNNDQDPCIIACLLENVISTVIVLASGGTIPDEYLINTYLYITNIRNEFGENPPNIAALIEFLKTKASEEVLSIMKSIADSKMKKLPSNLIITRIPKDLQTKMYKQ